MLFKTIHLKDFYPVLDNNGADPLLEIMVQSNIRNDSPRPSVLICPGGGYAMTWGGEGEPVGYEFMTAGCNCFVLRYSVKPHIFPQAIAEVACAVDYIVTNADRFGCDAEKTAILGFSAGGHLAASYCTLRNQPEVLKYVAEPKPVQAAILGYPVISADGLTHLGSFVNISGHDELTASDVEFFSLDKHIDPEITPKTFIWTTSTDTCVDPVNSLKYAMALGQKKIQYELHVFPEGSHGQSTGKYGVVDHPDSLEKIHLSIWCDLAKRWLKYVFKF